MTSRNTEPDIEDATEKLISDPNHNETLKAPSESSMDGRSPDDEPSDGTKGLDDLVIKPTVADSLRSPKMIRAIPIKPTYSANPGKKYSKTNTELDPEIPEIPEMQSRKQFKTMTSIEQAKDRAQVTAATSMSIVHVALLKDLLDDGPEGNPYYKWTLGFIVTALILQVFAGFISLYIALLRFYFTEYQDDFLDDCIKTCCLCRVQRRKKADHVDSIRAWIEDPQNDKTGSTLVIENGKKDEPSCCPFYCTTSRYAEYEREVLELYELMVEENIKSDLLAANYDLEIKWLDERNNELKSDLEKCEADVDGDPEIEEDVKIIKEELRKIKRQKHRIKERHKNAEEYSIQGPVLEKHVEQIQEERVLKRSTFWQNWLNMMMYTVFVLNALIAGFGLAHPSPTGDA